MFKVHFDEKRFENEVLKAARKSIEERVGRIVCPVHHQRPSLRFTGFGDKLSWEVMGCCDQLQAEARKVLG